MGRLPWYLWWVLGWLCMYIYWEQPTGSVVDFQGNFAEDEAVCRLAVNNNNNNNNDNDDENEELLCNGRFIVPTMDGFGVRYWRPLMSRYRMVTKASDSNKVAIELSGRQGISQWIIWKQQQQQQQQQRLRSLVLRVRSSAKGISPSLTSPDTDAMATVDLFLEDGRSIPAAATVFLQKRDATHSLWQSSAPIRVDQHSGIVGIRVAVLFDIQGGAGIVRVEEISLRWVKGDSSTIVAAPPPPPPAPAPPSVVTTLEASSRHDACVVGMVSQITIGHLPWLASLLVVWQRPISVTVVLSSPDDVVSVHAFREAFPLVRQWANLYLVVRVSRYAASHAVSHGPCLYAWELENVAPMQGWLPPRDAYGRLERNLAPNRVLVLPRPAGVVIFAAESSFLGESSAESGALEAAFRIWRLGRNRDTELVRVALNDNDNDDKGVLVEERVDLQQFNRIDARQMRELFPHSSAV